MLAEMTGVVVRRDGAYHVVETDGPPHLKRLELVGWQLRGATVGDRVRLQYQTTPAWGLWNVVEVMVDRVSPFVAE